MNTNKQILLIILDGWGYREETKDNAIAAANPQYFNSLWQTYPHTLFEASGEAVGLPEKTIGTSEIGHLTIGAGRIIYTDIVRVFKDIRENTLKDNQAVQKIFNHVKTNNSTLHFMGLLSPGGVHSHQEHLYALLKLAKDAGISDVAIHVFTDGRDVPPESAVEYITQLLKVIKEIGLGRIGTVMGRYFAMDRDTNWDRTQKAVDALFEGKGEQHSANDLDGVVKQQYQKQVTDEFIPPQIITDEQSKPVIINKNDGVFFFNFRPDRARQITKKVLERAQELNLCFVTLTQYDKNLNTIVAFPPLDIKETLSDVLAQNNLSQAHIAETEKYAHVTYFFNGGNEIKHEKEEFVLVNSRKDIPTFDLAPAMSANEIADKTLEFIEKNTNFIVINFANADMVGHTGKMAPAIEAIKAEDEQIKRVSEAILQKGGIVLVTADHGNAEIMVDEKTGAPYTAHTLDKVPFILTQKGSLLRNNGKLSDVAPTILKLFNLPKPQSMTGESLISV